MIFGGSNITFAFICPMVVRSYKLNFRFGGAGAESCRAVPEDPLSETRWQIGWPRSEKNLKIDL